MKRRRILDLIFTPIFIKNHATPETSILPQVPSGSSISACQRLPFWYHFSNNFLFVFLSHFLIPFSKLFANMVKKINFVRPSGPKWHPKSHIAPKMAPNSKSGARGMALLQPSGAPKAAPGALGIIFMILGGFQLHFS